MRLQAIALAMSASASRLLFSTAVTALRAVVVGSLTTSAPTPAEARRAMPMTSDDER